MKKIKSEMAGTVLEVTVAEGDKVTVGQEVVILESMKMEVPVVASEEGTVTKIVKKAEDFVNEGDVLIELG